MNNPAIFLSFFFCCLAACSQSAPPTGELPRQSSEPAVTLPARLTASTKAPPEVLGNTRFTLPVGWSVQHAEEAVALLNPGFRPEDTVAAVVVLATEARPGTRPDSDPVALLREQLPRLAVDLQQQQVRCRLSPRSVTAGELSAGLPYASLAVPGRADGGRPVVVWAAVRAGDGNFALLLVVAVQGMEERFVAGATALLQGLVFAMPVAPVGAVVTELVGLEFGSESFGSDASLTTVYRFADRGALQRRTMFSSSFGSSDRSEAGRYQVIGDTVELRVGNELVNARLERRGGRVVTLRIGSSTYRRL